VQRIEETQDEQPVGQTMEVPDELTEVAILEAALATQALALLREYPS